MSMDYVNWLCDEIDLSRYSSKICWRQMNATQPSRSHSVFTIKIEQRAVINLSDSRLREQMIKAKVNLVDLPGSVLVRHYKKVPISTNH